MKHRADVHTVFDVAANEMACCLVVELGLARSKVVEAVEVSVPCSQVEAIQAEVARVVEV
jgi:hypothetical protein